MTDYKHRVKPIPAYRDVPFVAAPPALGLPRRVSWGEVVLHVRTIGFVDVPHIVFHATSQSWPRDGGRALVLTGHGCGPTEGLEVWTPEQLADILALDMLRAPSKRIAGQVWANPLRADPGPWPATVRMIEFK